MKQTIVIDNRPGGARSLGRDLGAKAVPDGYTLLLNSPEEFQRLPEIEYSRWGKVIKTVGIKPE